MANILVVDDIEDNVFLLKLILEKLGHKVLPAYNGMDALKIADGGGVDLVLLDVMMPMMSGLEVASRLRAGEDTKHIPIILLTAKKNDVSDVVEGLAAGANEYVTKPFHETELVARVNSMLHMKDLYDEVAHAKALMTEELKMAQIVQASLLPTVVPYMDKIRFDARYQAAQSLGGDYYDIIDYGGGKAGVVIADVSGHGPSAALIVSMVKAILTSQVAGDATPRQIAERLNLSLVRMIPEERFVTLFLGLLDVNSGKLRFVRGGHPHPFLLRKKDRSVTPLKASGDIVGMFDDIQMDEEEITLEHGDRIVAYSDGLIEVHDNDGKQYGVTSLQAAIEESFDSKGEEMVSGLLDKSLNFAAGKGLDDDVALFILEML
ncbi:MAG: SpoIIE family protein phosphatase [Nitrospinae bacterium]|nr:SpoIIE family protein phosphatase [Nitrospinota bacterium]